MAFYTIIKNKLFADIKEVPNELKKPYYPFIDGLRALAIISVILSHVFRDTKWLKFVDGSIGVHLFFIISGFLITTLLLREKINYGNVSYKGFYARRALRIFPVAYLFILVLILLNSVFKLNITPLSFLTSVFYLKNFPLSKDWHTAHFWTLSIEEQFYLFAPVLLITNTNRYIKLVLALAIAVPVTDYLGFNNVGVFYTNHVLHTATFIFLAIFNRGALYILSGSLLAIFVFKRIIPLHSFQNKKYLSLVLLLCAFAVHFPYENGFVVPYVCAILFTILILAVIALNITKSNFLTTLLSNKVLVKIGILSYSLYIWQQIFTVYQPWAGRFKYADSEILNLMVLFIVAWASYTFYESKFLKLKKRYSRKITANPGIYPANLPVNQQ
jgi:peptidoglycan/LPS O-acetylase OafA/YrhL